MGPFGARVPHAADARHGHFDLHGKRASGRLLSLTRPECPRPAGQLGKSTVVSRRDPPLDPSPRGSSATMDRVSRFFGNLPGLGGGAAPADAPLVDTAEKVQISSLALLKMLKHGTCMLKDPRTFVQVELVYPWK